MGLERRQPSQNFRPIISERNDMAIVHVGTVGIVGKTVSIMILGDGCINRILYPGQLGLWGDLVTKLGSGDVFLSLLEIS